MLAASIATKSTRRDPIAIGAADRRFTLDSNVLVYTVDGKAGAKQEIARQIVVAAARLDCCLTLQTVSEFYWVASRKRIIPASLAAERANDWLTAFRCVRASEQAIRAALPLAASGLASYWDALFVATAAEASCTHVLTEDMQNGSSLCGVRIHNPFLIGEMTDVTRQLLEI